MKLAFATASKTKSDPRVRDFSILQIDEFDCFSKDAIQR